MIALLASVIISGGRLVTSGGAAVTPPAALPDSSPWIVAENRIIWTNDAVHCGFPVIEFWSNAWHVAFRSSAHHTNYDGFAQVITSTDTTNWTTTLRTRPDGAGVDSSPVGLIGEANRLVLFSKIATNFGSGWANRTYTTTDGTAWTTNPAANIAAWMHQPIIAGGTYYWSGFTGASGAAHTNGLWSSANLIDWSFVAWTCYPNGESVGESATWIEGTTMYQLIRREDAAGRAAQQHASAYASYPYTNWTQSLIEPFRIEGAWAKSTASFGKVLVHRHLMHYGNIPGPGSLTYVSSIAGASTPRFRVNLSGYVGDTGYGDAVEVNGSLYVVYYAGGVWGGKANIWMARITK